MKILFLTPVLPWPLRSGGQIRAYHLLKALHQNHQVNLVSYIREEGERQYLPELKKIADQTLLIKRQYNPWTFTALIKTLFSSKPLVMNIYKTTKPVIEDSKTYDLIYCECFYLMDKIPKFSVPIFLSEQNIEYLAYRRYVDSLPWWKKAILWLPMKLDVLKMKYWEVRAWQEAKRVAVMSETDRKIVEEKTGRKDVFVIPNGVDTENFVFSTKRPSTKTILFVGNFNWFQNLQAADWLVKEIFPEIKKKVQNARLLIVGHHVPKWLKGEGKEGITVEESLEDIREAYQKATVLLAPLKSGGGTKYKILEAMASGVPVVTTSIGAEGLDGDCMVVRDNTEDQAASTVDIINNPNKYLDLVKRARKLVEENYDWKMIGQKLENFVAS